MTSVFESGQKNSGDATTPPPEPAAQNGMPTSPQNSFTRHKQWARWVTLAGYFGLLALILNWFSWLSPPASVPRALPLIVLSIPLLFPLRGLLHGKVYTHAWVSLLALPYFAIGIDVAFNRSDQRWLGIAMVVTSLAFFTGAVLYSYAAKRLHKATRSA